MLENMTLKFGSSPGREALSFDPGPVTVFVGPNNSGKTLILREIHRYILHGEGTPSAEKRRILDELAVRWPPWGEIRALFANRPPGLVRTVLSPSSGWGEHLDLNEVYRSVEQHHDKNAEVLAARIAVRASTLLLDGERRLSLLQPVQASDPRSQPTGILQALFQDDTRRNRLAALTRDAFGFHFVVDPTCLPMLRPRLSRTLPSDPGVEKSLAPAAIRFYDQAFPMDTMGDGIKAFCGVMAAVLASDVRIVLIDEPEAFLHPPTARKLGTNLVILGAERQGSLVVSTHSADVLMGCVQAGKCLNIVRLTYQEDVATARLLPPDEIRQLMLDPLLRSTAVLSALFCRGAVVCEGDSDRVLYQEINERLIASRQPGSADCVFLNAQNKSTIRRIIEPLRKMGVPAAAVVDLDILKGDDLKDLLRAASVPDGVVKGLGQLRGEIEAAFKRGGREPGKDGIDALAGDERESAQKLLSDLKEYGIFVVPVGNLERWLPELNVLGEKSQWLSNVLTALGSDPGSPGYVLPKAGDVWSFIEEIGHWIVNPHKKGVPD